MEWQSIDTAPKDGSVVLVNDTNKYATAPWVAAKWLSVDVWSGWVYDDDQLADSSPLGPEPTHWLNVPSLPTPNVKVQRAAEGGPLEPPVVLHPPEAKGM